MRERALRTLNQAAQLCQSPPLTLASARAMGIDMKDGLGQVSMVFKEEILKLRVQMNASSPEVVAKIRSELGAPNGTDQQQHLRAIYIVQCIAW
jgi:hypothetical protein